MIVARVEDFYKSLESYEDEGHIVDGRFGLDRALYFSTRFFAPDKLIYCLGERESPDTYLMNGDEFRFLPSKHKGPEAENIFSKFPGTDIDSKSLVSQKATLLLSAASTISGNLSPFVLNLLVRETSLPLWTQNDDFRKVGFKKVDGHECYVLRRINEPLMLWVSTSNFSIRKIEVGANLFEQASQTVVTALGGVGALFSSRAGKLLDKVENAKLERTCTFKKLQFNHLKEEDLDFASFH